MTAKFRNLLYRLANAGATTPGVRVAIYAAEAARFRAVHGGCYSFKSLVSGYRDWKDSQKHHREPLEKQEPWLTFGAIRFLSSRIDSASHVFEFGSGGSTLFVSSRAGEVVTVEHDRKWADHVEQALRNLGLTNCTLLHVPPVTDREALGKDPCDPEAYISTDERFLGQSFKAYVSTIDLFPDQTFQAILVDGRSRPSCCKHAIPKLAPGGIIILDNAERAEYKPITKWLDQLGWRRSDFAGPGPYNRYFWKTTAWTRPV